MTFKVAVALVVELLRATDVVEPAVGELKEHEICAVAEAGEAQERVTVPLNPEDELTVIVELPEPPAEAIVTGSAATEKEAAEAKPGHALASASTSIDPRPVARSYPVAALYPIWNGVVVGQRSAAGPVLGVPDVQGTMLLPVVMS